MPADVGGPGFDRVQTRADLMSFGDSASVSVPSIRCLAVSMTVEVEWISAAATIVTDIATEAIIRAAGEAIDRRCDSRVGTRRGRLSARMRTQCLHERLVNIGRRLTGTIVRDPRGARRSFNMEANEQSVRPIPVGDRDVTILAVDDQEVFRDVLRDLIATAPGFLLVGEACSGEDATRAVDLLAPDLVLMDVTMPGIGGIAAARQIVSRHPKVAVVLISVDDPSLHPGVVALGNAVACTRKQDLRPRKLRELWELHHT
jgi:CheY-like chemotaxis protein